MAKKTLYKGIIFGAMIGGLSTLCKKDVRDYAKTKLVSTKDKTCFYMKNPSKAIRDVRMTIDQLNENLTEGAESTLNALEQIENTLDSVIKDKQDQKLIQ